MLKNVPIQVLASCDAGGAMRPLRFRFVDGAHRVHTVSITQIVDERRVEYVGLEAFVFLCRAEQKGREKLYELRYGVAAHRWTLVREIY